MNVFKVMQDVLPFVLIFIAAYVYIYRFEIWWKIQAIIKKKRRIAPKETVFPRMEVPSEERVKFRQAVLSASESVGKDFYSQDKELESLERHLRTAIFDQNARERLIGIAMKEVGDNRKSAIKKVLKDLNDDNERYR